MEYIIRWRNQSGVKESGMSKWILQLRDDKGTPIKTKEDTTASNLQNFSDVVIRMSLTQEEALRQTATNKMMIYFDSVRDSTKMGELTVLFDRTKLPLDIASIARSDVVLPKILAVGDKFTCSSNDPFGSVNMHSYEYMGDEKIKLVGTSDTSSAIDCSSYKYTGLKSDSVSVDGRCGYGYGRCPGTQCCSQSNWCGGERGTYSDWCSRSDMKNGSYSTFIGANSSYDGNDLQNMKVDVTSDFISTDGTCGPNYNNKICPYSQCCSYEGKCGGSKPNYSTYCSILGSSNFSWRNGYTFNYKGFRSEYDWDQNKILPLSSQKFVFKCDWYDPLLKNNQTIYKWENNSLKNIASVPPGYQIYNLPNCDGIEYGGQG